jgi:uncharacterized membrane protein
LLALLSSVTLYGAAAVAGVIQGVRSRKAAGFGKVLSHVVVCPLASVLGGGLVLVATVAAAFHCFE